MLHTAAANNVQVGATVTVYHTVTVKATRHCAAQSTSNGTVKTWLNSHVLLTEPCSEVRCV